MRGSFGLGGEHPAEPSVGAAARGGGSGREAILFASHVSKVCSEEALRRHLRLGLTPTSA